MQGTGKYLWAGLDMLSFFRNLLHITITIEMGLEGLSSLGVFNVITRDIFIVSLLFSAYYTFKQKKIGFWIYAVQLPFRAYFFIFSFSVLYDLPITYVFENGGLVLAVLVPALELLRIWYWVKNYQNNSPKSLSIKRNNDVLDDGYWRLISADSMQC